MKTLLGALARNRIRAAISFVAICASLVVLYLPASPVTPLDERLRGSAMRMLASTVPEERIAVVDIDETSIAQLGPWPWPRSRVADLVEMLFSSFGAKSVALDIVFPEAADVAGDSRLASLAAHAPLIVAQVLDYGARQEPLRSGNVLGGTPVGARPAVKAEGYLGNHDGFREARCAGNVGFVPDDDGVLRRIPLLSDYAGTGFLHFSAEILKCVVPTSSFISDARGFWRIPFHRELNSYLVVPAHAILDESIPSDWLRGRHVIIGSSSLSIGDSANTPLAPLTPGVLVHASALSAFLDTSAGDLKNPWDGRPIALAWTIATVLLAAFAMSRFSPWGNLSLLIFMAGTWLCMALWGVAVQANGAISAPLWAYIVLLLAGIPNEWWYSQLETRRVLDTFSHYVARPVLDEIVEKGLTPSLVPTLRDVTVLIADMEGYTRATSQLSLSDAAALTKDFLDCLTRPVLASGGTLDKYSGDGLVAFWGAPVPCADQADRAVGAALAILREVSELNRLRRPAGIESVRVRIGIESGPALVGDLGTPFRSTYTAVGDCINFASRLESAARDFSTPLLIGPEANVRINRFQTQLVGKVNLRGTETSMDVYSVDMLPFSVENSGLLLQDKTV